MEKAHWSKNAPNENGFYWLRRDGERDTIVKIHDIESGMVEFGAMVTWVGSDWGMSLCEVVAKWQCSWDGPLVTPNGEGNPPPKAV